jgi:outer membrane protein OmpA-like peptidoglycan-associated protein
MVTKALASSSKGEETWLSISDLMTGLMMLFLFIAISYMTVVQRQMGQVTGIAMAYQTLQDDLYSDLAEEFKGDLVKWRASIEKETLSVRFDEPEVLFEAGQSTVTDRFRVILTDFFPRYLKIIYGNKKYRDNIEEIRIEGHTSSEWYPGADENAAYFYNMNLSQARTRAVLEYCMNLRPIRNDKDQQAWVRSFITANGLSSSKPVLKNGKEDKNQSRRVEFRTKTTAERQIHEIIRRAKQP